MRRGLPMRARADQFSARERNREIIMFIQEEDSIHAGYAPIAIRCFCPPETFQKRKRRFESEADFPNNIISDKHMSYIPECHQRQRMFHSHPERMK